MKAIEERRAGSTWTQGVAVDEVRGWWVDGPRYMCDSIRGRYWLTEGDATFIAHAPADIDWLLEDRARLERENKMLKNMIMDYKNGAVGA